MTAVDDHPALHSTGREASQDLAAVLPGVLAAHRLCYPEASEALISLAEDLADVLSLAGAARNDFLASCEPGTLAGTAVPPSAVPEGVQAVPGGGVGGMPGVPDATAESAGHPAGRQGHLCLGCGCRIAEGLLEIRVQGRRYGARYRHADSGDCADALRAPQPNRALIGVFRPPADFAWGADREGAQLARTVH
jgi:hypothetical protein